MTALFVLCEHGKLEKHVEAVGCPDHSISHLAARAYADAPNVSCTVAHFVQCPGGRPATVEEVVEWLDNETLDAVIAEKLENLKAAVDRAKHKKVQDV